MKGAAFTFREAAAAMPIIAILRGLEPSRAESVVTALAEAGVRVIEIPLNRDGALAAIGVGARVAPAGVIVGAGTVITRDQARAAHDAGARVLVMPNVDGDVIDEGHMLGLAVMPGVLTPTDALAALGHGADALKLFPAEVAGPAGLRALRSILPSPTSIYVVGGVTAETMRHWRDAGADGFGIGGALFKPEYSDQEIASRARAFVAAWHATQGACG